MATELQVVDQAVLERRLGNLDRLGGVQRIDLTDHRQDQPQGREDGGGRQAAVQDRRAQPEGHSDDVVEHDLEEQDRQEAHQQRQARRGDVRELDATPCALKLVVDKLLVVQQLTERLRLRPYCHDARSSQDGPGCRNGSSIIRPPRTKGTTNVVGFDESLKTSRGTESLRNRSTVRASDSGSRGRVLERFASQALAPWLRLPDCAVPVAT